MPALAAIRELDPREAHRGWCGRLPFIRDPREPAGHEERVEGVHGSDPEHLRDVGRGHRIDDHLPCALVQGPPVPAEGFHHREVRADEDDEQRGPRRVREEICLSAGSQPSNDTPVKSGAASRVDRATSCTNSRRSARGGAPLRAAKKTAAEVTTHQCNLHQCNLHSCMSVCEPPRGCRTRPAPDDPHRRQESRVSAVVRPRLD